MQYAAIDAVNPERDVLRCLPEFNNWAGMLPLKVYLRQGFQILHTVDATESIPGHLRELTPRCQLTQAVVGKRTCQ